MLIVEPGDPKDPRILTLMQASHRLMQELFEPDDIYALSIDALTAPDIHFYAARAGDRVLGTGALAVRPGYGEVKSMFTDPTARGRGVAAAILRQIEDHARDLDLPLLRLETGKGLDAAIRLYERNGFVRRGIFGDYDPNDTSVYMEKTLHKAP